MLLLRLLLHASFVQASWAKKKALVATKQGGG